MKMNKLKIGTQLQVGFAILLFFVIILGAVSYMQTDKIHQQTEDIYDHPLQARKSIGQLSANIYAIRLEMKNLVLTDLLDFADKEAEQTTPQVSLEILDQNVITTLATLRTIYLGPVSDIDSLEYEFVKWKSIRKETIRLNFAGKKQQAAIRTTIRGIEGKQAEKVLRSLEKISLFATGKGDELYEYSRELNNSLNRRLLLLIAIILVLSLLINYILLRSIKTPINELTNAARLFHEGDMAARSSNTSTNEFGLLSASFNSMVENIQVKTELDDKFATLAALMLSEYDIKKFFQTTLNALALHTGSQVAAIYLLSEDKKHFNHFESIGAEDNAHQSFAVDNFEGEFGVVLSTRKVHHLKSIPDDTRFIFKAASCKFIPREIITLPIITNNEVVAIISMASVDEYSKHSILLIDRILATLCARVEGILAYEKIKGFSQKLEYQNSKLEAQKKELASQSVELLEQNTELEMQKKQLGEASRLKTNFLSNMSHELRTPLNSVIALSGVLHRRLDKKIPDEEYSYLEVIERNGKHLLKLINDILDISRIEAGREEVEVTTFNPCKLINELVSMIKPQAKQKNIELQKAVGDCEGSITSDAAKCRHILQNLISNAIKFTKKGRVKIKIEQNDKNIAIRVIDTGIGIVEEQLSHIFDEFRQADSGTSRRFGGSGLGLAIAKKYAHLLGGTLTVKSTPGKGSEFTLTLPVNYTAENTIIEAETSAGFNPSTRYTQSVLTSTSSKTILLVEDSKPAIIQMKDFLEESEYKVLAACNGEEALAIIAKTIPDAMILDLMMPGIDGFHVLKTIREAEATAHVPVLILTAKHITQEELKFLKRNNIHQLIQKGDVNRNELLNAIATMVSTKTAKPEPPQPQIELQYIEGKPAVLVIEDNADSMITAKAILADNYTVIEATDGKAGIEMAKKHVPHLILMDIELPGTNGFEAFKVIRSDALLQHIPVIALTASAMTSDREAILAYGFDAYIAKPLDHTLFFKTINEILYGK